MGGFTQRMKTAWPNLESGSLFNIIGWESIAIAKAFGEFAVHVTCKTSVVTYID